MLRYFMWPYYFPLRSLLFFLVTGIAWIGRVFVPRRSSRAIPSGSPAVVAIWPSSGSPRSLWIQTGGVTALRTILELLRYPGRKREHRAARPTGATTRSAGARRPSTDAMRARRAVIERTRASTTVAATPNGSTITQRWRPTLGESSEWRTHRHRDGGLPLRHGASRHAEAGSSTPLVLFFFSVPRDTKKAKIQFRRD